MLFNTLKAYVFQQDALKNLILNPSYVCSLQQEGRVSTFLEAVYKRAYLYIKQQAYINLRDNQYRLYKVKKEHQISLSIIKEIRSQQIQQNLYSIPKELLELLLPYYIILVKELFRFLYAQINKYYLLFKYTYAYTFRPIFYL